MTSPVALVGLLVALPEELAQIKRQLARPPGQDRTHRMHGRSGHDYELFCHPDHPDLTIACGVSSGMGLLNASLAAHRLMTDVQPSLVVMTGIAGSLSEDAQLGDAVIASAAVHYLAEAKAVDKGRTDFRLRLDGHTTLLDPRLTTTVRGLLDEMHREDESWTALRVPFADHEYLSGDAIAQRRRTATRPQVLLGKIASGDVACGSRNFQKLLLAKDRKLLAIDMESAGAAVVATSLGVPWLFVRGISDYSDGHKTELDTGNVPPSESVGPWRRHAAEFAGRILVALLPHVAHSLRLGSAEGITERNQTLELRGAHQPSPAVIERRIVGSFGTRVEPVSGEISAIFRRFCADFLGRSEQRVMALGRQTRIMITCAADGHIAIHELDPAGSQGRKVGRIDESSGESDLIAWEAGVTHESEESVQSAFNQTVLWLAKVPPELKGDGDHDVATVDADGNVTIGARLFLRRFSRVVDTSPWSSASKIADMRIELARMLGASPDDTPALVRALRTSIRSRGDGSDLVPQPRGGERSSVR